FSDFRFDNHETAVVSDRVNFVRPFCLRRLPVLTAGSFLFFTALVAFISWRKTRGDDTQTASGYFLAGRSLTSIVIAGSLLLTNLSTEQLVGLNGGAFNNGMVVMAWEVVAALAMLLMAVVFLPRYLRSGITTVPQFLELRYDSSVRVFTAVLFLASLVINFLPFVLYSGAVFMRDVFGLPAVLAVSPDTALWMTVIAIGLVGSCYAVFGGLKAVAVSDTLNGIGLLVGGLSIPILGLIALGKGSFSNGLIYLTQNEPQKLSPIGGEDSAVPFATLFTGMIMINTYYWCTNQAIVQRTFGAKSLAEGQKGLLLAAFCKLAGPFYLVLPGIIAFHMFPTEPGNGDGAYGMLVNRLMPHWALGFFAAVIFGAILSSFNSALNSASTLFSVDLYGGLINKNATDQQKVQVGKICGLFLAIVAMGTAPLLADSPKGLFELMKKMNAFFNIPLLAIIVVGITTKRVPAFAANVAIVLGMVFYGIVAFLLDNVLFGQKLHWLHVAAINFGLLVSVMLAFGFAHPRDTDYKQVSSEKVDIQPWRAAVPCAVIVASLVVVMYWFLHRLSLGDFV
ncbi:UNVERIFIED_CONTAM: hypothetical protein GTU68_000566, partial [Idotea baltica]|nr:hypothetical protein [Idotea baltica]